MTSIFNDVTVTTNTKTNASRAVKLPKILVLGCPALVVHEIQDICKRSLEIQLEKKLSFIKLT